MITAEIFTETIVDGNPKTKKPTELTAGFLAVPEWEDATQCDDQLAMEFKLVEELIWQRNFGNRRVVAQMRISIRRA
jgi:hypothetical protein